MSQKRALLENPITAFAQDAYGKRQASHFLSVIIASCTVKVSIHLNSLHRKSAFFILKFRLRLIFINSFMKNETKTITYIEAYDPKCIRRKDTNLFAF